MMRNASLRRAEWSLETALLVVVALVLETALLVLLAARPAGPARSSSVPIDVSATGPPRQTPTAKDTAEIAVVRGAAAQQIEQRRPWAASAAGVTVWWPRDMLEFRANDYFWLHDVLGALDVPLRLAVFEGDAVEATSRARDGDLARDLHIFVTHHGCTNKTVLQYAPRLGLTRLGLMVINDEQAHMRLDALTPEVVIVLRPYFFERVFADPRHVWIPTGYLVGRALGQARTLPPASTRHRGCVFEGAQQHGRRREMVEQLMANADNPCVLHLTGSFMAGSAAATHAVDMLDTVFVLCPGGYSVETLRLYETLENGAIPVMEQRDYDAGRFNVTHAGNEIVVVRDWASATATIRSWLVDAGPDALDALQRRNYDWWQAFKATTAQHVAERVCAVLPAAR